MITNELFKGRPYKVLNGTWYNFATPDSMVKLLEGLRQSGTRLRFHWGDTATGQDWGNQYDVTGTIDRSMGPIKSPLLIHNKRSFGGGIILTDCIVKITTARGKELIYKHPDYKEPISQN